MSERQAWIAQRAYELWEQAGRPDGQDRQHWQNASGQWDSGQRPAVDTSTNSVPSDWDDEDESEH